MYRYGVCTQGRNAFFFCRSPVLFTNTRTHLCVQKTTRKKNVCYFLVLSHLMWTVVQLIQSGITFSVFTALYFFLFTANVRVQPTSINLRTTLFHRRAGGRMDVSVCVVVQPMQKMLAMTPNDRKKERVRTLWDDSYFRIMSRVKD